MVLKNLWRRSLSMYLVPSRWVLHPDTLRLNRWVWLPIIVVFSLVGPLAYLLLGNRRSTA